MSREADSTPRPLEAAGIDDWYRGLEFAFDWTSNNFPVWTRVLAPLADQPLRILEIGSYEGRSAIFFLNFLRRSAIVCVDVWHPSVLEPDLVRLMPHVLDEYPRAEGRFDRNMAAFADRVTKIKARSDDALADLGIGSERFDLIYIDGEHRRRAVYRDCMLSWPLLKSGGMMVIDDYGFDLVLADELRPKQGVDAFLAAMAGQFDVVHLAYQVIIRKR